MRSWKKEIKHSEARNNEQQNQSNQHEDLIDQITEANEEIKVLKAQNEIIRNDLNTEKKNNENLQSDLRTKRQIN